MTDSLHTSLQLRRVASQLKDVRSVFDLFELDIPAPQLEDIKQSLDSLVEQLDTLVDDFNEQDEVDFLKELYER